jgi:hypothetical protein
MAKLGIWHPQLVMQHAAAWITAAGAVAADACRTVAWVQLAHALHVWCLAPSMLEWTTPQRITPLALPAAADGMNGPLDTTFTKSFTSVYSAKELQVRCSCRSSRSSR